MNSVIVVTRQVEFVDGKEKAEIVKSEIMTLKAYIARLPETQAWELARLATTVRKGKVSVIRVKGKNYSSGFTDEYVMLDGMLSDLYFNKDEPQF